MKGSAEGGAKSARARTRCPSLNRAAHCPVPGPCAQSWTALGLAACPPGRSPARGQLLGQRTCGNPTPRPRVPEGPPLKGGCDPRAPGKNNARNRRASAPLAPHLGAQARALDADPPRLAAGLTGPRPGPWGRGSVSGAASGARRERGRASAAASGPRAATTTAALCRRRPAGPRPAPAHWLRRAGAASGAPLPPPTALRALSFRGSPSPAFVCPPRPHRAPGPAPAPAPCRWSPGSVPSAFSPRLQVPGTRARRGDQ